MEPGTRVTSFFHSPRVLAYFFNPYLKPIQTTASVHHSESAVTRWCPLGWCKTGRETVPCTIWFLAAFQVERLVLWCQERSLCWRDCRESQTPWICWPPLQLSRPFERSAKEKLFTHTQRSYVIATFAKKRRERKGWNEERLPAKILLEDCSPKRTTSIVRGNRTMTSVKNKPASEKGRL